MAEVPSTRTLPLGSAAPAFELPDAHGKVFSLDQLRGSKGLLVMFVCNHCPYVVHLAPALGELAQELEAQGINVVAINSNDTAKYTADAPAEMPGFATKSGWHFPYLVDESQSVAHAYAAACTPDFYLFDSDLKLTYCGQFDDSRPRNQQPVTGASLRAAVQTLLQGQPPLAEQRPSTGCNIKWKPGNEPGYFQPKK